ncbi:hypothetical protein AC1031_003088 [Aphanomyces cochlioides]|nr:hypothetical protein AC1031_003088 [Aphanomyces cochlioides]
MLAESSMRSWEVRAPVFLPWKTAEFLPPVTKPRRGKKQVVFTTATTFVFPLDAIPSDHGTPIGLAKTHTRQECHDLDYIRPRRSRVRKFDHVERMLLLQQKASYTQREVAMFCFDAIAIRRSSLENEDDDSDCDDELVEAPSKRSKLNP